MATVNKNFRIKHGLIVEGTTGTINGQNILTETGSDTYILNLIGGETLVKSVSNEFNVSVGGELSLDRTTVDAYYDPAGSADAAETAANLYTDGRETAITAAYESYADTAEADAVTAANSYTDGREIAITAAYESYADTAEADAVTAANSYTDGRETAITAAYESYADTAEADAVTAANSYTDGRETAITTAYQAYADQAEADAISTASADATSKANAAQAAAISAAATDATTKANAAQAAAELHADTAIANLVDSAPGTLDTLNELAAALQDNPDIISDLQDIAAGKQDTLTAGSNIDITGSTISVTGLTSADISDFDSQAVTANTGLWDTIGAAAAAQTAAEGYADGLAVNYDAAGAAAAAQTAAEGYADGLAGDILDGTSSFTAINYNDVAKQVAATTGNIVTAAATTAISWTAADYRSAKLVVKAKNGVHTQVSDLVVTLDTANNVAVSEYGITYSNGAELAAVTADYSGSDVRIRVTPANDNTEVVVVGTLIK